MKIVCPNCGDDIADNNVRRLFSNYDLSKQSVRVQKIIESSFAKKPCPNCGGALTLVDGKYETLKDGKKLKEKKGILDRKGWKETQKALKKAKKDKEAVEEWKKVTKSHGSF